AVAAAVVDHEHLDRVHAVDAPRDVRDGAREGLLLVQARNLDDHLHRSAPHHSGTNSHRDGGAAVGRAPPSRSATRVTPVAASIVCAPAANHTRSPSARRAPSTTTAPSDSTV